MVNNSFLDEVFPVFWFSSSPPLNTIEGKSSKSVLGREAKSLKNGIPTLCKGLQFNPSAPPCRPHKQTNKNCTTLYYSTTHFTTICY